MNEYRKPRTITNQCDEFWEKNALVRAIQNILIDGIATGGGIARKSTSVECCDAKTNKLAQKQLKTVHKKIQKLNNVDNESAELVHAKNLEKLSTHVQHSVRQTHRDRRPKGFKFVKIKDAISSNLLVECSYIALHRICSCAKKKLQI